MKRIILPLLFLLAACGNPQPEKFPFPPQFVQPDEVSLYTLPAPPQPGSDIYAQEIKEIVARQRELTPADIARIDAEKTIRPEMLVQPVLGAPFTREKFPALYTLLDHAASDAWRINDRIQDHWKETRPWLADSRVARHVEYIDRPGYPSGHTVTNGVWAHILADLMPCEEDDLFERAWAVGYHRVDGGAHFPHDVEAGKKLARVIYHRMLEDDAFLSERAAARAELQDGVKFGVPMPNGMVMDPGYIARCKPLKRPPVSQIR